MSSRAPATGRAGTDEFAAVDWLIAQHPQDRFAPVRNGPFRLHNVGMTYGLESAGGYDSVSVWRYVELLQMLNTGAPYPYPTLRDDLAAGVIKRFDSPLVDLLERALGDRAAAAGAGWVERFSPTGPAARRARAHLGPAAQRLREPARAAARVRRLPERGDRRRRAAGARAWPDARPAQAGAARSRAPADPAGDDDRPLTPAPLTVAERQRLVIEADAPAPGILVVSETWYPGWSVTVDGKPAPLLRADHALRGVALPAGHHAVEMRFRSRPTQLGLALAALGLLGLAGLLFRRRVV